jgi:hypothetical protein
MDWRPYVQIVANPGQADPRTQSAPALASYNGLLYLVYRGPSDNLFYISFDGHRWARSATKIVANPGQADPRTQSAPALASYNGLLYLVYRGPSDNLFYISFDGHRWARTSAPIAAGPGQRNPRTQSAPALASYNGLLHLVYRGDSDNLFHITYDQAWARSATAIAAGPGQPDPQAPDAPVLAAHEGLLNMVHQEQAPFSFVPEDFILTQSVFDGHSWTAAELSTTFSISDVEDAILGQPAKVPPALTSYNGMLRMVLVGDSNAIVYSVLDPDYILPTYQLYVSTPSVSEDENGTQTISAQGSVVAQGTDPVPADVTLRLRRDIPDADDVNLTQVTKSGINVDLNLKYQCPGGVGPTGGTWQVFAEVLREGSSQQSSRIAVENCITFGSTDPANADFGYRFEVTDNSGSINTPVLFTGRLVTAGEASNPAGVSSFSQTTSGVWAQDTEVDPQSNRLRYYYTTYWPITGLQLGTWSVQAQSLPGKLPVACTTTFDKHGANPPVLFEENIQRCSRDGTWPTT